MRTITQHFETVIITAYIAKQKIIVERLDHSYAEGLVQPTITPAGFYLDEHFIQWEQISTICLAEQYFHFWKDIVQK